MTTTRIQVPNIQKPQVIYDTGANIKKVLRTYYYCKVCKRRSRVGWSSLARCPFCGARFSLASFGKGHWGTCEVGKTYNREELRYIMNHQEGFRTADP